MPQGRVLRTRFLPPRLPASCLPRRAVVDRVVEGLSGRLVIVSAGAGYGKSTLLAQAVARLEVPWVWVSLDERIAEPALVLAHLAAALAERFPGFGTGLAFEGPPERQVRDLVNEVVSTVADDLVIVLDDVHVLREPEAAETLELLMHDLPPNAHLALCGRTRPRLPLARLRPQGVLEVTERDLALTERESADLLKAVDGGVPRAERARLAGLTEGWVTGLLLVARSGGLTVPDAAAAAEGRLVDYLAQEVLEGLPDEVQEVLIRMAVLERFTPALAAAVSDRPDARDIASGLVEDHLFVVGLDPDGGWMRFHSVFLRLLRRRLASLPDEEVAALNRRAGDAWREIGDPDEAVRHYVAAGDLAAAVEVLEPVAERMIANPEGDTLVSWLETIPAELWADVPGLVLARASALFARARYPEAFTALERAMDELTAAGDRERAASALFRYLRALALVGGQHERAIRAAERYLPPLDPVSPIGGAARVVAAGLLAQAGRRDAAEAELMAVGYLAAAGDMPVLGAFAAATRAFEIDHPMGESAAALSALEDAIAVLERHDDEDDLSFLPFARAYRAVILNDTGMHDDALAEAARVREAAERRGLGRLSLPVVAWLRFDALAGLGRWAELGAELAWTAPIFTRVGAAARGYRARLAAARLAAATAPATVGPHLDSARAGVRSHGTPVEEAVVLADLALAAAASGNEAQARDLAVEARLAAEPTGSPWARAASALASAIVLGDSPDGDAALAEAVEASALPSVVSLWSRTHRDRAPALLARAMARDLAGDAAACVAAACGGEVVEECATLLADAGPAARARLAEAASGAASVVGRLLEDPDPDVRRVARRARDRAEARPRPPLRIVSLGGFSVWREGTQVPDAAFERQKARVLLAILLCARGPVHRERLVEEMWPTLTPERGLAALHSTLYALRRALEPGLSRGAPSSLVVSEGSTYRLVLGDADEWDTRDFLDLARAAGGAQGTSAEVDLLLEAEAAHGGPFLPEWPYAEWASPLRAEVEETLRLVLERLAGALAEAGQPGAAISRYRRLLAVEPEREGWHRALMRVYAQAGERALALRQYHACRALLRQQLGVEPSRETRALYADLLREEN